MKNPMALVGQTILVTGASSGIGREVALLLSELGAKVILVGRRKEELEKTKNMLEGTGHNIEVHDLTLFDDISVWMKKTTQKTGPLYGLVHSAGLQFTRPLRITTGESLEELMRTNVTAAFCLAKGFRQKGVCTVDDSRVVFISSVMGFVGQAGQIAYSASKAALIGLTKSLAMEVAREGIRVNCVAPAVVKSDMSDRMMKGVPSEQISQIEKMHPLGIGTPRDVAYAIAFLLAETGRWITGTTLVVDGGYTAQ